MKLRTALASAAVLAVGLFAFAPAAGAAAGDTTTTFVLTAGTLSITVPSTSNLGSQAVNTGAASVAGLLGVVSVADNRGALLATWTATVSSTDFTTGGGATNQTVTKANISYASGTITHTGGTGAAVFTPQVGAALTTPQTAASLAAGIGNNTASWDPTLTFTLATSQVAGTYSGTVTHSVV